MYLRLLIGQPVCDRVCLRSPFFFLALTSGLFWGSGNCFMCLWIVELFGLTEGILRKTNFIVRISSEYEGRILE